MISMSEAQKLTDDALKAAQQKIEEDVAPDLNKIEEEIRKACALGQSYILFESKNTMHDLKYLEFIQKKLVHYGFDVTVSGTRLTISWSPPPQIHVRQNPDIRPWND